MKEGFTIRFVSLVCGLLVIPAALQDPLRADDTEIYTGALSGGFEEQVRPNILYVIDTSGSMDKSFYSDPAEWWEHVPDSGAYAGFAGPYDASKDYSAFGDCDPGLVYRKSVGSTELDSDGNLRVNDDGYPIDDNGEVPFQNCDNDYYFPKSALHCKAALDAFEDPERGWYRDRFIEKVAGKSTWFSLISDRRNDTTVIRECDDDNGVHGHNTDNPADIFIIEDSANWSSNASHPDRIDVDTYKNGSDVIVADGNFLNWFNHARTRIAAVQGALADVIQTLPSDTNVGLMRFDSAAGPGGTDGGMMIHEFVTLDDSTARKSLVSALYEIPTDDLDASTPLSETMYEAFLVFAGEKVYFGAASEDESGDARLSVPESRDPSDASRYRSPITATCQENAVVYFTDGTPSSDKNAWDGISGVDGPAGWSGGFDKLPGLDDDDHPDYASISPYLYGPITRNGNTLECNDDDDETGCLPTIAAYMQNEDVNPYAAGDQHVTTYTIGFSDPGDEDSVNPDYLDFTAEQGGGDFRVVTNAEDLADAFVVLTRQAVSANTAFTAPALAVNAFNRTRDENTVYLAMFKTQTTPGWGGNVKAYQFAEDDNGEVYLADADGKPAVVPETGLFAFDARSIWSAAADGNEALEGGAASNLPATRSLYTWFGDEASRALVNPDYAFAAWNSSNFTDEHFGMDGTESYTRADLIRWLSGMDVLDEDGDGETSDLRYHIGDPLHSRPVIVTYGGSETDRDQKVFVTTNDGFLHVIDVDTGVEDFGFVALETLKNAKRMYEADSSEGKAYGLDGAPVLWVEDGDEPGINLGADTEDHVYLYVGMRRGGRSYYAFDFTNPAGPKILWRIQGGDLDGDDAFDVEDEPFYYLGQTWSTPQFGTLRIDNDVKKVLIFGGGFDPVQDDPDGNEGTTEDGYVTDDYGNAVYIVDAATGERLWWASSDANADLVIPEMENAVPSDIAVVDMDADGWTDRLYFGDMGGRLFRIDLEETPSSLPMNASGGMIADLGASNVSDDTDTIINERIAASRKFFYPPDVVVVENGSEDYIALAIGSGARNHPSYPIAGDTAVEDMFFVIRDPNILNPPEGSDYGYGIHVDSAGDILYDATDNEVMSQDEDVRDAAISDMAAAKGWYIRMTHEGEKVLAPALTFNYQTMFTSFEPQELDLETCQARTGIGRLYMVDLRNGAPIVPSFHLDSDDPDGTELTTEDRVYELRRDGIPPAPTLAFPEANDGEPLPTVGPELPPAKMGNNSFKAYWFMPEDLEE